MRRAGELALYSQTLQELPERQMRTLADGIEPSIGETERGLTYTFVWPDLTIIVSVMPQMELREHLRGFVGYVTQYIYKGSVDSRGKRVIDRILRTRLVVGIEIEPCRDAEERSDDVVGKLAYGLQPIIFFADALYDQESRLLLAPDGSFDEEATIE